MQSTKEFLMEHGNRSHIPIALGDVVGGRYRIEAVLGQGGMATVYRAQHTTTGRSCALKVVHAHLATNPRLTELFIKEARIGSRVGPNPHIVDVLDAGMDDARNVPFLVMELLEGETLEHHVEARGPLAPALLREVFRQLSDALHQAHAAGVVHRDLKPGNLFLTSSREGAPRLKVLDFGIAKILELESQKTATQLGTPAYAAPEQMGPTLRKIAAKQHIKIATHISPATDIWAIGLVAYELITGLRTGQYWGVDAVTELPTKVVLEAHEPASRRAAGRAHLLPRNFDLWFARCLDKDAELRWPTVERAIDELLGLLDSSLPPRAADLTARKSPQSSTLALASTVPASSEPLRPESTGRTFTGIEHTPSWPEGAPVARIEVVHQNVLRCECDVLIMKHAQAFYGADASVARRLAKEPMLFDSATFALAPGEHAIIDSKGLLGAKAVLFLGVPPLHRFGHDGVYNFPIDALRLIAKSARGPVSVAMTLHGVSYASVEESMLSQIRGLAVALLDPIVQAKVKRVMVVEMLKERASRFEALLSTLKV
jgi:serine/threonine protein kinase